MTPIDSRVVRIVRWLLNQTSPSPTAALAADLGLSQRIVRYRLPAVENYLLTFGASLERRRGSGIALLADSDARQAIIDDLESRDDTPRVYAAEERARLLIAGLLWAAPDLTSLDDLHLDLGVSKTSARRDLQLCEPWLERNNVPVIRRPGRGVGVVGSERRIRQVTVQLLLEAVPAGLIQAHVRGDSKDLAALAVRVPSGLRDRLTDLPLSEVADAVGDSPLAGRLATEQSETVFVLYLAVTIARLRRGRSVETEAGLQRSIMEHPVADSVAAVIPRLEMLLAGPLDAAETSAIAEYWLGLNTVSHIAPATTLDPSLIDGLLTLAGERLHPALRDDRELRHGLAAHLERLVVRLRHGLPVHNPLLGEVRARYPEVHAVATELGGRIGSQLGATITEDELGFITMYLSGAMERARLQPRRRVAVVCPSGMATAWVLVSRIQAEFPEFDLVEVLSEGAYEALDLDGIDLVISTVPVTDLGVPVVVVSPLLSAGDVKAVVQQG